MELDSSNVIQMALQGEHALLGFIVPHLDFVVISTTNKHWLRLMEMHATNRPIMLFKLINECLSTVIKKVNGTVMERCQDPWSVLVE